MTAPDAARPQWLHRQERGSLFWLRIMRALSLGLGRRATRPILYGIALYFLLAAGKARQASRAYLSLQFKRPAKLGEIYRHFLAFASTVHDRVFLLNDRFDAFDIEIKGAAPLHSLVREQGGVFLFGAHMGSFEVIRAAARTNPDAPQRICLAMYEENARRINAILAAINPTNTPEIIPLGTLDSMLAIHRSLNEGAIVGVLADRSLATDDCVQIELMGRPALLPTGPFRMAALLKRPVVFMAGLYRGGRRYEVHFELIADFSKLGEGGRDAAIRQAIENYVVALESYCRKAPFNWFNFYDFWDLSNHAPH